MPGTPHIITTDQASRTFERIEFSTVTTTVTTSVVAFALDGRERLELDTTPVADHTPGLAAASFSAREIVALDVLEHVVDEEAWLACFARLLAAEAGYQFQQLSAALNVFRYVQDVTGFGKQTLETKMKGWHRHYRQADVEDLLRRVGLVPVAATRSGSPHHEAPYVAALAWGTMVRRDRGTELRAGGRRKRAESGPDLPRLGPLSTKITVTATKPAG